jgi:hypothetical protein
LRGGGARAYLVPREERTLLAEATRVLGEGSGTPSIAAWRRSKD